MTPEDQLAALMEAVVGDLEPPVGAILAEAERRGRRMRRRRRVGLAVVSVGAVLVSAAGVGACLRFTGADAVGAAGYQETGSPGPPGTRGGLPAHTPTPTPTHSAAPASAGTPVPLDNSAEILILHTLLPTAWTFGSPWKGGAAAPNDLWISMNDGYGEFTLFVAVASAARSGMDPVDCSLQGLPIIDVNATGAARQGCTMQTFPNGDKAMEEMIGAVRTGGYYQYRIIVSRMDGIAVEIEVSDGVADSGAVTRAAPPLTPATWASIACDRLWQLDVPAAPAK